MEHADTLQLYGTAGVRYNVEAMTRSDVQLMLDVKAGDEASFNLLLQKYRTPLVNFLYRMVRNTGTAEDLAQEVVLRVYRARKQYSPCATIATGRWMSPLTRPWRKTPRRCSCLRANCAWTKK